MSQAVQQRGINVKVAIFVAMLGALGCILSLFVVPVAPNIAINFYVISGVLAGATIGPALGLFAGFLGALYTPILWGWFGAIPYNAGLGLGAGLASKFGIRATIGAFIAHIVIQPPLLWAQVEYLGTPVPVMWVGLGTATLQLALVCILVEGIISLPALRKRLPRMHNMQPVGWVSRSPLLRHPWVRNEQMIHPTGRRPLV